MVYYLVLAVFTTVIVFLSLKIWKKTREIGFILGLALIYYWSLLGAWFVIYDSLTNNAGIKFGLHYYYLFERMFPVKVDGYYMETIVLYSVFIIVIQGMILLFAGKDEKKPEDATFNPIQISHKWLIIMCLAASVISLTLVWKGVLTAAKFNQSVYIITRQEPGRFFTIHQLLNETAVVALFLGFVTFISGDKARYLKGHGGKYTLYFYILSVFFIESYLLFLGNKREILFGGILGILMYLYNVNYKVNKLLLGAFLVIIVAPIFFCDGLRTYSPKFLLNFTNYEPDTVVVKQPEPHHIKIFDVSNLQYHPEVKVKYTAYSMQNNFTVLLFSDEMFCAQFSMYGILSHHIPITYGSSFVALAASLVPHALWKDRPHAVYEYYISHVTNFHAQGFTIHHASAWYLNFGIPGVIAGAMLFGFLWAFFYKRFRNIWKYKKTFAKIFYAIGFAAFTAQIPSLMRNGPIGYKALFFEALLLPAVTLFIAERFLRKQK